MEICASPVSVGGVLLGVSPYWALETVPIGFAMLVSYLLFLTVREYSARNIATQAAIVALGAATSFAALTAAYFAVVGQLPRFNIQYENDEYISGSRGPGIRQIYREASSIFFHSSSLRGMDSSLHSACSTVGARSCFHAWSKIPDMSR